MPKKKLQVIEDAEVIEDAQAAEVIEDAQAAEVIEDAQVVDLTIFGTKIGTYYGWAKPNDTTILFYNYKSSVGLPDGVLGYDSLAGQFSYYGDDGVPTLTLSVIKVLYHAINPTETPVEAHVERIAAAAVQWDGVTYSLPRPARHGQILHSLEDVLSADKLPYVTQGFITSEGRFVNRVQALQIAHQARQIIKKTGGDRDLFSEDVW
jgi:hypothetical protein